MPCLFKGKKRERSLQEYIGSFYSPGYSWLYPRLSFDMKDLLHTMGTGTFQA
ncbi:hypothetical protein Pint_11047 [Pistacia integerrima]|uniref:Uncharacterized protein n=1 Tax=Pistacia integerrima TaxID=434235 RepID=A0ACC0XLP2_9ROSI|nr:hypothetical protein Pint_11047 [Pistacia integerrima]